MSQTTHWEGVFSYELQDDFGDSVEYEVPFIMKLQFENNAFEGTRIDAETKDHIPEPIKVKGFVDEAFISYTVAYPYAYFFDEETGKIFVEKDIPHPGVTYSGNYDSTKKAYFGEWTVISDEEKVGLFLDDAIEESWSGFWQMKRVKKTTEGTKGSELP